MAKYHVNAKGEAGECSATKGVCPFGDEDNHYTSAEAARAAFEKEQAGSFDSSQGFILREITPGTLGAGDIVSFPQLKGQIRIDMARWEALQSWPEKVKVLQVLEATPGAANSPYLKLVTDEGSVEIRANDRLMRHERPGKEAARLSRIFKESKGLSPTSYSRGPSMSSKETERVGLGKDRFGNKVFLKLVIEEEADGDFSSHITVEEVLRNESKARAAMLDRIDPSYNSFSHQLVTREEQEKILAYGNRRRGSVGTIEEFSKETVEMIRLIQELKKRGA